MLKCDEVCGIMVTYNPDNSILENVSSLISQIDMLFIFDNGSNDESKKRLLNLQENKKIIIYFNDDNKGIAYALNKGLNFAIKNGYKLILTMDQDSRLKTDCIYKMISVLNSDSNIVSVGPNYLNRYSEKLTKYIEVEYLITSGNLTYTEVAKKNGGYCEKLFIDSVDFDFSLSLRLTGKKIVVAKDAKMEHKIGETQNIKFFCYNMGIQTHSSVRYYYIFRNHYYIVTQYFKRFPGLCIKKELGIWIIFLKLLVLHTNKKDNLLMVFRGIGDAIQSKYGQYDNL